MKYQEVISTEGASFFALCAGHYLNHVRPTDEAATFIDEVENK